MVIDVSCLDSLPQDGSIEVKNIVLEQEEEDLKFPGTGRSNNDQFEYYREELNTSSFFPASVKQTNEAKVFESFVKTVSSPELDIEDKRFNEFDTAQLAKMDFPTLFPDGLGNPTDNATVCDFSKSDSYAQKLKQLVRFG